MKKKHNRTQQLVREAKSKLRYFVMGKHQNIVETFYFDLLTKEQTVLSDSSTFKRLIAAYRFSWRCTLVLIKTDNTIEIVDKATEGGKEVFLDDFMEAVSEYLKETSEAVEGHLKTICTILSPVANINDETTDNIVDILLSTDEKLSESGTTTLTVKTRSI